MHELGVADLLATRLDHTGEITRVLGSEAVSGEPESLCEPVPLFVTEIGTEILDRRLHVITKLVVGGLVSAVADQQPLLRE